MILFLFFFWTRKFKVVDIILDGCTCSQIDVQRHKCLMAITSCWPSLTTYVISECVNILTIDFDFNYI